MYNSNFSSSVCYDKLHNSSKISLKKYVLYDVVINFRSVLQVYVFSKRLSALNSASFVLSSDTSLNCNRNYLTFLIFKTNMFFQIWQLFLAQSTLNWYGWKPLFSGNSAKKCVRFNLHLPSESFFKVGRLEEKSVPKQREFGSSNWRHIFFSYLR